MSSETVEHRADFSDNDGAIQIRSLSVKVIVLWRLNRAIGTLVLTAVSISIILATGAAASWWVISVALLLSGIVAAIALPPRQFARWQFGVGESDLLLRRGLWWRRTSIVPYLRIQYVDTNQSPLERFLGLATVIIHTAGSVGGTLAIEGLELAEAENLRDHLAALSGSDDAV